ncbi:Xylose isomerase-like TIM barrel [Crateriforma conspicua]|uniref:Xylose isomerase-like TIM barrel n=2 Tax=Crateriforma conspicua TaxID=2527996 RepID=A0A5C5Y3L8_9PLAN|nr:Xylose isomerase-like TIM barrel [Crateriforma conspicua]TWT69323.1 Xylose isomerase-like TIM barrel [Crateriforma conspicua]
MAKRFAMTFPPETIDPPKTMTYSRRQVLCSAAAALAIPATTVSTAIAREPIQRTGPSRLKLALAAYSFRQYFSYMKGKKKQPQSDGPAMDMEGFLQYCADHGCDGAELTSYFFRNDPDRDYFLDLKRSAFLKGLAISGTAIGNNFTVGRGERLESEIAAAKQWIDHAAVLGAPHIRFFAGTGAQIDKEPARIDEAIEALEQCAEHAANHGIMLGVENHGNLTSDQMLTIMQRVSSPWVGMNLDTGNFFSDDPYGDLEKCVGYAVNVQVKVVMRSPDRTKSPADLKRIAAILRDGGYQGFVNLEYEEEQPYEHVPQALDELRQAIA